MSSWKLHDYLFVVTVGVINMSDLNYRVILNRSLIIGTID
jgi:hypothetical protein